MEIVFSQVTRNQPFPKKDLRAQLERTGFWRLGKDLDPTWAGGMLLLGLAVLFSLPPNFQVRTGLIISLKDLVIGPSGLTACRLRIDI